MARARLLISSTPTRFSLAGAYTISRALARSSRLTWLTSAGRTFSLPRPARRLSQSAATQPATKATNAHLIRNQRISIARISPKSTPLRRPQRRNRLQAGASKSQRFKWRPAVRPLGPSLGSSAMGMYLCEINAGTLSTATHLGMGRVVLAARQC